MNANNVHRTNHLYGILTCLAHENKTGVVRISVIFRDESSHTMDSSHRDASHYVAEHTAES